MKPDDANASSPADVRGVTIGETGTGRNDEKECVVIDLNGFSVRSSNDASIDVKGVKTVTIRNGGCESASDDSTAPVRDSGAGNTNAGGNVF